MGFELFPAIDLRGGRVVRLLRGDFAAETAYEPGPGDVASGFAAAGAPWLHVVDLDAARQGERANADAVTAILAGTRGSGTRVEVAGGLRDETAVGAVLESGAARAVLGTAALADAALVSRLVARHGATRIAVALDVSEGYAVGAGWAPDAARVPVLEALARLADAGVRTFEVTAIDRDGTLAGPDLALLAAAVAAAAPLSAGIVASAGIASVADLRAVRDAGCTGAIVGRALYEGRLTLEEALRATRTD